MVLPVTDRAAAAAIAKAWVIEKLVETLNATGRPIR
jgi:hypothetical protein